MLILSLCVVGFIGTLVKGYAERQEDHRRYSPIGQKNWKFNPFPLKNQTGQHFKDESQQSFSDPVGDMR
ncbi:MAG: hypothetical protein QG589_47 [Patescibacteria group bacterium]|nr:hypothetical protein [Patescibacteria group bacterium]